MSPSISKYPLRRQFVTISQNEIQNQVLVVHASVRSASNFQRTNAVKRGNTSGLTD